MDHRSGPVVNFVLDPFNQISHERNDDGEKGRSKNENDWAFVNCLDQPYTIIHQFDRHLLRSKIAREVADRFFKMFPHPHRSKYRPFK